MKGQWNDLSTSNGLLLGKKSQCPVCGRTYTGGKGYCPVDAIELTREYEVDLPQVADGKPGIIFAEGRCAGGSTVINTADCEPTPDAVYEHWRRRYGLDLGAFRDDVRPGS